MTSLLMQVSFYTIFIPSVFLSLILNSLIIGYIESKPPGRTVPFDCVTIDTVWVQIAHTIVNLLCITMLIIFDDGVAPMESITFMAFLHYTASILGLISSHILNSLNRIIFLGRPGWVFGLPDSQVKKVTRLIRFCIASKLWLPTYLLSMSEQLNISWPFLSSKLDSPVLKTLEGHSLNVKKWLSNVLITGESDFDERNGQETDQRFILKEITLKNTYFNMDTDKWAWTLKWVWFF